ncbi:Copine-domain-containing protein [Piromyces finnis]|uniref:Copine-domain-containing protein n=1 Tax=Piromyces finnis TaxID=1754191 RepID=A0A1Y1V137_9FUNG|nr:Copine-domain-containing protein [Piromyces finnis]|eukprot:ORX44169.1 Copine-domain-containing protein [Piromyces finnis]
MSVVPPSNYYKYSSYDNAKSLSSKVEIKISCVDLPNFDTFSKSDPKVFIFLEKKYYDNNTSTSVWEKIDSTERIKNNDNPEFVKAFYIDYYFEMIQNLRFLVFDMDSDSDEWSKNDYIGYCERALGDLISSSENNVCTCDLLYTVPEGIKLDNSKTRVSPKKPKIKITIREVIDSQYVFEMDISGKNLDKKDTFGKSDPFIIISRIEDNGTYNKVFETPVIKNTLNPKWKGIKIPEVTLNNGEPDRMLLWEVYDWDRNSDNDLIGVFMASSRMIFESGAQFEVINDKKKAKKGKKYTNSGVITFDKINRIKNYSFMDFPMGGTEIAVSFSVDFTSSNGNKNDPSSLHYNSPNYDPNNFFTLNEYQKAISSIGYVLEPYDSTKTMEVYGYGGEFFNRKYVEFECPLTGDPDNPSVYGVAGILTAYYNTLQTVVLYGPTNFSPIIKNITAQARNGLPPPYQNNPLPRYHILTIITDGIISDMSKTKEAIIDASDAPLSIIIIGVGRANFDQMNELDGDGEVLRSQNKYSKRDIVQFVPLANYINNPTLLAAETLSEIPKQVTEFATTYKYRPPYL